MKFRWLINLAILVAALAGAAVFIRALPAQEQIVQPIAFNHEDHVKGEEMDCTDCHAADESSRAGFADIRSCYECHKEVQGDEDTELQQAVREYGKARREIPWVQVTHNPGHVYFSHRAHVAFGGMKCEDCHGDMGARTTPPTTPDRGLKSMDRCISCHRERNASLECISCHG